MASKRRETLEAFRLRLALDPEHQADVARWRAEEEAERRARYEERTPAQVKRLNQRLKDNGIGAGEGAVLGDAIDRLLADKDAAESGVALVRACVKWADRHAQDNPVSFAGPLFQNLMFLSECLS